MTSGWPGLLCHVAIFHALSKNCKMATTAAALAEQRVPPERRVMWQSVAVLLGGLCASAAGCTTLIVGRRATDDGSVMCTHTDDGWSDSDARLTLWPAADYPPGSTRNVYYGECQHAWTALHVTNHFFVVCMWAVGENTLAHARACVCVCTGGTWACASAHPPD